MLSGEQKSEITGALANKKFTVCNHNIRPGTEVLGTRVHFFKYSYSYNLWVM